MTKFICELGKAHEGKMDIAKKMILEAKEMDFYAVKAQAYNISEMSMSHKNFERYKQCHLTIKQLIKLKEYADELGIKFWCSVFSEELIEPLSKFTDVIKIPSTFYSDNNLLNSAMARFDECHVSTGFHDLDKLPPDKNLVYYLCTSLYPTPNDMLRLERIPRFNLKGFSYHGNNPDAIAYAIMMGVEYVELHYTSGVPELWQWDMFNIKILRKRLEEYQEMWEDKPITKEEKKSLKFFKKEFK